MKLFLFILAAGWLIKVGIIYSRLGGSRYPIAVKHSEWHDILGVLGRAMLILVAAYFIKHI